jgi:hypothetical protein
VKGERTLKALALRERVAEGRVRAFAQLKGEVSISPQRNTGVHRDTQRRNKGKTGERHRKKNSGINQVLSFFLV